MKALPLPSLNNSYLCAPSYSDVIVANSAFTRGVFQRTFRRLRRVHPNPEVLHPCIDVDAFNTYAWPWYRLPPLRASLTPTSSHRSPEPKCLAEGRIVFLSINRFERKKAIETAVRALAELRSKVDPDAFARVCLVVAGGYDTRVKENVDYHQELVDLADVRRLPCSTSTSANPVLTLTLDVSLTHSRPKGCLRRSRWCSFVPSQTRKRWTS